MNKEKIKKIIKERITRAKEEYNRQCKLFDDDKGYDSPDYTWYITRLKTFNESLELIGMLD